MFDDEVRIELGGRERVLRYTANSLARLEEKTALKTREIRSRLAMSLIRLGKIGEEQGVAAMFSAETSAALSRDGLEFSTSETRALLWAALLHEEPALTLEAAGNLLDSVAEQEDMSGEDYVFTACAKAFLERFASRRTRTTLREMNGETVTA